MLISFSSILLIAGIGLALGVFVSSKDDADGVVPTLPIIETTGSNNEVAQGTPTPISTPGVVFFGYVHDRNGEGESGVEIFRKYSSYEAIRVAMTGNDGYYQSDFFYIPGDEMITLWANKPGMGFSPEYYYWRHYHGYEGSEHNFVTRKP